MMTLPRFSWRQALAWRFGAGPGLVLPRAATMPATGWVGNGTSVPSSSMPNEQAMLIFGRIDRVLLRLPGPVQTSLSLAYGDRGSAETSGGLLPQHRWRALAPLTPTAQERGQAWCRREDSRFRRSPLRSDAGPPGARWWSHVTREPETLKPEVREAVRREASDLLDSSTLLWVAAYQEAA